MRKLYRAAVCVFRQGASQTLEADVSTCCGQKWELWKSPSAFNELTFFGGPVQGNTFEASFTANEDGSNIRGVKFIRELTGEEYKSYTSSNSK